LKPYGNENNPKAWKKVIGVMKDFNFDPLDQEIKPLLLTSSDFHMITLLVKLNPMDIPLALATTKKAWTTLFPDKPFDYSFVDEDVANQYAGYSRWMKITGIATTLAILIASLGLFGLAGIQAVNKTKEIGIRKVLGADLTSLFILLNRPFVFMAIVAFVLATPAAWYVMNQWLTNFKYHITIGWELFAISMLSGLLIALISVSYHGIKTANVNPAETLKSD
jgi:putative ABC transport system permease protein